MLGAEKVDRSRGHVPVIITPPPLAVFREFGGPVSWFEGDPVKAFSEKFFGHAHVQRENTSPGGASIPCDFLVTLKQYYGITKKKDSEKYHPRQISGTDVLASHSLWGGGINLNLFPDLSSVYDIRSSQFQVTDCAGSTR